MSTYDPDYYQRTKERQNAYARDYYKKNREKIRKQQQANRNKPENKEVARAYAKKYIAKKGNELKIKKKQWYQQTGIRFKRYGITQEQYENMVAQQQKKCLICGEEKTLVIDHCHSSNKVRGLLCHSCNKGLGCFYDNPDLLKKAIQYVKTP